MTRPFMTAGAGPVPAPAVFLSCDGGLTECSLRLFLRDPKGEARLGPCETYTVAPRRPHLVVNAGDSSATFLVLQGVGENDYVPHA